jgi:HK97 family phage portal protein
MRPNRIGTVPRGRRGGPGNGVRILGLNISRATAMQPPTSGAGGGWWPVVRESFTGAWQQNVDVSPDSVLAYFAVYACITLIASDIGKLYLRLVSKDANGIWTETDNPAFSPVLRKPNRYQTINKFVEQWIVSKLINGNAYILKERDARGVVVALYVLNPMRVMPLIAPDGSVYYQLGSDPLSELPFGVAAAPASEIIHDTMVALFHPLVGVTPIYACGLSAMQGLQIQTSSAKFFGAGSQPGGVLTAPGAISDETAARLKAYWDTNFSGENVGKVAVVGDGLTYIPLTVNAADAQLIEQLKWSAENVCSCYHVPPYMVNVGPTPPYANVEPVFQQYYAQCLQSLLTNFERSLDAGLGLIDKINGTQYGTEFDIDDLIWMDTATKTKAAGDAISAGAMSPDEARKRYFGLGPVEGGDTPYMQQQMYSLAALAERDADQPFSKPTPGPDAVTGPPPIPSGDQVKHVDVVIAALLERELQAVA